MIKKISSLLRRTIPEWAIEAAGRLDERLDPYVHRSYSQEGEDMILRRVFDGQVSGFYVDVGAHHPRRFSNTYYFYRLGWSGINIEPNPETFRLFQRSRQRDINLQIGVSDTQGEMPYYIFNEPALNTFDSSLAAERQKISGYRLLRKDLVKLMRLDEIFHLHVPSNVQIDFMSIDVEGLDHKVLSSNDWTSWRPRYILVEDLGFSINQSSNSMIHDFLGQHMYELHAKTINTLVYKDRESNG